MQSQKVLASPPQWGYIMAGWHGCFCQWLCTRERLYDHPLLCHQVFFRFSRRKSDQKQCQRKITLIRWEGKGIFILEVYKYCNKWFSWQILKVEFNKYYVLKFYYWTLQLNLVVCKIESSSIYSTSNIFWEYFILCPSKLK